MIFVDLHISSLYRLLCLILLYLALCCPQFTASTGLRRHKRDETQASLLATLKDSWSRFDATLKDLDIVDWELKALGQREVQEQRDMLCSLLVWNMFYLSIFSIYWEK